MRRTPVVAAYRSPDSSRARAAGTGPRAPGGTGSSDPVGTARTHYHRPCSDQPARTEDARRQARSDRSLGGGRVGRRHRAGRRLETWRAATAPLGARAQSEAREGLVEEPCIYCLPMSVPRVNPYPWKFSMSYTSKGLTHLRAARDRRCRRTPRRVYGWPKHPADPFPTWWGHSIGSWSGDTLVIDTVGYNDKFWFDARGTPHTEQLHTIERWTRVNNGTLVNEFTLDDPARSPGRSS